MENQAAIFKSDILRGISLAIKNLQQQDTEWRVTNPKQPHSITKQNLHFRNLLNYLDMTFSFALKDSRKGYWPLIKKIAHTSILSMIDKHKLASSEIKKGYLWLYLTFVENSLMGYVKMMMSETKFLKSHYQTFAVLRDFERSEILINLLAGTETLMFTVDINDPYLDYGHDPFLRQEKVVPHVKQQVVNNSTIIHKPLLHRTPKQNHTSIGTEIQDVGSSSTDELVYHVKKRSKKKKNVSSAVTNTFVDSAEIPSIITSVDGAEESGDIVDTHQTETSTPGSVSSQPGSVSSQHASVSSDSDFITEKLLRGSSDPMMKSFIKEEHEYENLLKTFSKPHDGESSVLHNDGDDDITTKDHAVNHLPLSTEIAEMDEMRKLAMEDDKRNEEFLEEDDFSFYRTDSFDKFCRKNSMEESNSGENNSIAVEEGELAESDDLTSPVVMAPQISEDTLRRTSSPMCKSISKSSIDKLNDARYDTRIGILLPTLPRRPSLNDSIDMYEEINIAQNDLVLLSIDIFQKSTETMLKTFNVYVGHMAGYGAPFYLLVSNFSVYLLKKNENSGFVNIVYVNLDLVNKVQTGLNFQDVFLFHDQGCLHVSTRNEVVSRMIISTIKGAIKSTPRTSTDLNEPMASNTYNELDLIIQDWLICHSHTEEPEILHFSLIYYSSLASERQRKNRVRKAGQMFVRQSNFGLISYWENAFFALRGHMLYHYNGKRTDLKQKYDLSTQCGGCVSRGKDDGVHILNIIGIDGCSPVLELGITDEMEANDWLMSICQVVADAKINQEEMADDPDTPVACGLVLTQDKIYVFNQDPKSGRLVLEDSCPIQNITQVCVDNHHRTFCTLAIDNELEQTEKSKKTIWLFDFESEYELGKFEQRLYCCWQLLYQVPLQFVLLADQTLKKIIKMVLNEKDQNHGKISSDVLYELISN